MWRFLLHSQWVIENYPLQVYSSALLFSPASSLTRQLFEEEELDWVNTTPKMANNWSPCLRTLLGHQDSVTSVVTLGDSTQIASSSMDRTIRIWDIEAGQCIRVLQEPEIKGWDRKIAYSATSKHVFSVSGTKFRAWNAETGQPLDKLEMGDLKIRAIAVSDGVSLLALSKKSTPESEFLIWDLKNMRHVRTLPGLHLDASAVAFSDDGHRLVTGYFHGTVQVWDVRTEKCLQNLEEHTKSVSSVAFSRCGDLLASGSDDETIKIWNLQSEGGQSVQTLIGHRYGVASIVFSNDGRHIISGSYDKTVKMWVITSPHQGRCVQTFEGHQHSVTSVAVSGDGRRIISASLDGTVKIWDTASKQDQYVETQGVHRVSLNHVAYSKTQSRLVTGSSGGVVEIWDTDTVKCIHTLEEAKGPHISAVALSSTGQVVSASSGRTLRIWNLDTGGSLQTLTGHEDWISSIALLGKTQVISGSWDKTLKIWDMDTGQCLRTCNHGAEVWSVAWASAGRVLSGSEVGTIKVWDAETGQCLRIIQNTSGRPADLLTYTRIVISRSYDDLVKMWDYETGFCLYKFRTGGSGFVMPFLGLEGKGYLSTTYGILDLNTCVESRPPDSTASDADRFIGSGLAS